jgi:hypothetical protein
MAQATVGFKTFETADLVAVAHGIALGCTILTLDGEIPVEYLAPGDRILTRSGARRLRSVEMTVVRHARVIRIAAGTLGMDRPGADMIVTPDQPILIRDWRARALYGAASAMVPAARLADGEYIRAEVMDEVRFYTLRLDGPEVIYAGGLELACVPETVAA